MGNRISCKAAVGRCLQRLSIGIHISVGEQAGNNHQMMLPGRSALAQCYIIVPDAHCPVLSAGAGRTETANVFEHQTFSFCTLIVGIQQFKESIPGQLLLFYNTLFDRRKGICYGGQRNAVDIQIQNVHAAVGAV